MVGGACDCQGMEMLRILFTADDFASTRFLPEPAPMLEMKFAARGLRSGIRAPWGERWRYAVLGAVPLSAEPMRELTAHFSWSLTPDDVLTADLDESIEMHRRLTPQRAREELARWCSAPSTGVPALFRHALDGDRDAARVWLSAARTMFAAAVEPYLADVRANHHTELARQGRLLASRGVAATLATLLAGARWCGECLQIDSPQERTVHLRGRGLVVTPTAFWTGPPLLGESPDRPVLLAYPAPTTLSLRVGTESDPLAAILGTTRAAVLRLLAEEHTTGDIARRLGISAASASEQAAALRAARLIGSRRDGKAVVHHATVLGLDLVGANTW
jgi:DNA-binding transcriptional ArsR family regulator